MGQAKNAGAVIVKPAQDTFGGAYAGLFSRSRSAFVGGRMESAVVVTD